MIVHTENRSRNAEFNNETLEHYCSETLIGIKKRNTPKIKRH